MSDTPRPPHHDPQSDLVRPEHPPRTPTPVTAATLHGVTGRLVHLSADRAEAPHPGFTILDTDGRPAHETQDRVRAAIVNTGLPLPGNRIVIHVPPHVGRPTSSLDLALAALVLKASGLLAPSALANVLVLGELGLDGSVRPTRGVYPMVLAAQAHGALTVVVPTNGTDEALLVPDMEVIAVDSLHQFVQWSRAGITPPRRPYLHLGTPVEYDLPNGGDLADLPASMVEVRLALEVAASGGHHLGLAGPLGAGKLMIARRLSSLLPDLDDDAAEQVTAVRSAAGRLDPRPRLPRRPPFVEPHYSASLTALLGGGPRRPTPGMVSFAHHGILHLDDASQLPGSTIQALRRAITSRQVTLVGGAGEVTYPARVQCIVSTHSCACGGVAGGPLCSVVAGSHGRPHQSGISRLWQLTDIRLRLNTMPAPGRTPGETSAVVAARVATARAQAAERWARHGHRVNGEVPADVLGSLAFRLPPPDVAKLQRLHRVGSISPSGCLQVLRLAWSISDLRGQDRPGPEHLSLAIALHLGRTDPG